MHTVTTEVGHVTHVFTTENGFVSLGEWIFEKKGMEVYDAWESRQQAGEGTEHPESTSLYKEWLEDQGITHTITTKD
jgi:hypothetical protein